MVPSFDGLAGIADVDGSGPESNLFGETKLTGLEVL